MMYRRYNSRRYDSIESGASGASGTSSIGPINAGICPPIDAGSSSIIGSNGYPRLDDDKITPPGHDAQGISVAPGIVYTNVESSLV